MERVRFAPSPTGPLHIGGLRTALFNYLYAKKHKGVFILRVEDTDQNRKVEGSEEYIHKSLEWCNIQPDEDPFKGGEYGPYRQNERKEIYAQYIKALLSNGKAYYAFDSNDELAIARTEAERLKGAFKYSADNRKEFRNSLSLSTDESEALIEKGDYVVRLKVEPNQDVVTCDLVRGVVRVNSNELEDKILMKKDGMPTYHFANVVDDHLMKITTVIRGEEWLPSLPIHQLLYDAFGWEEPQFMHLPLILNPSGKGKLSKRDGDKNGYPVFPMAWNESSGYKENGFIPEAHINYIAQLGWSLGEKEILSLKEMENTFDVKAIQKGGARFDYEKAKWVNQQHLAALSEGELINRYNPYFEELKEAVGEQLNAAVSLIKERLVLLSDIEKEADCFINDPVDYDAKSLKRIAKIDISKVGSLLKEGITDNEIEKLKDFMQKSGEENDIGLGAFMQVLRVAVVGSLSGPNLIPLLTVIGKDVTLRRLERLISVQS
ncbi:MAG: glutamate--tRNA ligase [Flavobacteriaceae bacterium]|nr:glutamate--tRNA ligase [Flavobacteriaceae bacterium]